MIGLFGCISVVLTDIIGTLVVDGYNPIKQTISTLAINEKAWIQDIGLNLFAASFAACGLGFWIMDLRSGPRGKVGSTLLFLLAIDILVISERDTYGDLSSRWFNRSPCLCSYIRRLVYNFRALAYCIWAETD